MKKKTLKITFNAPFILTFVLLCFLATLFGQMTGGTATRAYFMTYHSSLTSPMTWVRFFTHVFGHSSWSHFISNAAYLLLLGPVLEEKHGFGRLLVLVLLTGLVTALINYFFFPSVALCGASGVVFAFIILMAFAGSKGGEIPMTLILVVVVFLGQQVYDGLLVQDSISNMAHIVGGAVGALMGLLWR